MSNPIWPEWGADMPSYHPWHVWTSPAGAHHAGYLLDTVIGPNVETGEPMVYEVLRCEPCLGVHVTPLPELAALAHYYATSFYEHDKPDYLQRYLIDQEWWLRAVHTPIISQALAFLGETGQPGDPLFLDIGSGPGLALDAAHALGAKTFGIEPNATMCGRGWEHGHTMYHGTLETVPLPLETWAILYAYETLEHQSLGEAFLLKCWDLLIPNGILCVVVPNEWNTLQLKAITELHLPRWWLSPPQHLWYWTKKTLQLQIRRAGFKILDMRSTFPIEQALFQGQIYIGADEIGRKIHRQRMEKELSCIENGTWPVLEAEYRHNLHEYNIGRELVCIAMKT